MTSAVECNLCAVETQPSLSPYAEKLARKSLDDDTVDVLAQASLVSRAEATNNLDSLEEMKQKFKEYFQSDAVVTKIAEAYAKVYAESELKEVLSLTDNPAVVRYKELQFKAMPPHGAAIQQAMAMAMMEALQSVITQFENPSPIVELTSENFEEEVKNSELPVVVDAYAVWCGPCLRMAPCLDELCEEMAGKVKFGKFDVDVASDLATRFSIQAMPTLLLFRDGEVVARRQGVLDKAGLENWINEAIG